MRVAAGLLLALLAGPAGATEEDARVFVTLGRTEARACQLFVSIANHLHRTIDGATISFTLHQPFPDGRRRTLQAVTLTAPILDHRDFWIRYVPIEDCPTGDLTAAMRSGVRCVGDHGVCAANTVLRIGNTGGGRIAWE